LRGGHEGEPEATSGVVMSATLKSHIDVNVKEHFEGAGVKIGEVA
jgi:hypothetical protein